MQTDHKTCDNLTTITDEALKTQWVPRKLLGAQGLVFRGRCRVVGGPIALALAVCSVPFIDVRRFS